MAEYTNAVNGVKVSVADHKELGSDWIPADEKKAAKTSRPAKSD